MVPAFARRTPQSQPLTASGRPKRATTLKKEAIKEEEDEAKAKAQKDKEKDDDSTAGPAEEKKVETKKGNQGRGRGSSKSTKTEVAKEVEELKEIAKEVKEVAKEVKEVKEIAKEIVKEEEIVTEEIPQQIACDDMKDQNSKVEEEARVKGEMTPPSDDDKGSETDPDDGEFDDDQDKDFDPDDDPEKLWCFCKKPHGNRFMICCDSCEDWFHGDCIGISMERGREMEKTGEEWCCNKCGEKKVKTALRRANMEKPVPFVTSPLNTPLESKRPIDTLPITKQKNLSMDIHNMKPNLAKSTRKQSVESKDVEEKVVETVQVADTTKLDTTKLDATKLDVTKLDTTKLDTTKLDTAHTEKPTPTKEKEKETHRPKQRRESNKQEFKDLLTFDQVPVKRDDASKKRSQERSHDRSSERRDSQSSEDDKKRKKDEAKKVRSSSHSKPPEPVKLCVREECNRPVMKGAIYCSRECIYKFANECIKNIEEEKKKKELGKSPDMKQETSKGTVICPATSSTDRVPETTQERIAVFEKATGKVVAGVMAPTKKYLFAWLEEHPTYEVLKPGKQPGDIKNSKNQDEVIRGNVRKSLRDILVTRCKETEIAINHEVVGTLSKRIESELLKMFNNETGQKYKTKYRSLIFNLKDRQNKILYKRVVSGEINPRQLVQMSPEQLATPELAQWRQQENKHHLEMVKKREHDDAEIKKNPPIKKTHKGEVVINEEKVSYETLLETKSEPSIDRKPKSVPSHLDNLLKDTTDEHAHHLFDSNCKICTGKIVPPGESQSTGVSTVIQAIPESSMPSPQFDETGSYVSSSPPSPDTSDMTSPIMSPPSNSLISSKRKQPSVWRGFVIMQKVAKFVSTAYAVSGSCESLMDILPDSIHVCGRIPHSQVWDYLGLLREGRKNHYKYLDVIRFEMSTDEEKSGYIKLYTYFYTRQRIGVIGNCYAGIKDIYILPLASHDPIPTELRPLPGLPKPRPHMLLGIIVRVKTSKTKTKIPEFIDSSPEMIIPVSVKKKKRRKEKKKEKEERDERDLDREREEISLERERVELEAQKKLIDIIFNNRASEAFPATDTSALPPPPVTPANLPYNPLLIQSTQSYENVDPPLKSKQSYSTNEQDIQEPGPSSSMQKISEEHKVIEEEQLRKLKEQEEEIIKLQSEVQSSQVGEQEELVMIPHPESIATNLRENVLNQISEAIHDVGGPREQARTDKSTVTQESTAGVNIKVDAHLGDTTLDAGVQDIVSLIDFNAKLSRPLAPEEKDPLYKAWLQRPKQIKAVGQPVTVGEPEGEMPVHASSDLHVESQSDPFPSEMPVHTSGMPIHTSSMPIQRSPDLSPSSQVIFSPGFTSPTSNMNQAHVQTLFSSISNSIAHVQSMIVSEPSDIQVSEACPISTSEADVSPGSHPEEDPDIRFQPISDSYSCNQDLAKEVLQDIEERFRPVCESTDDPRLPTPTYSSEATIPPVSEITTPASPEIIHTPVSETNSGIVDISPPPSASASPEPISPAKSSFNVPVSSQSYADFTISEPSYEEEERQKSDDDYALDLIEDIKIPANIPRRATLFSMDLIKMRQGIKMPELPDIKLPDGKETPGKVPPPIPAGIPTVPIPPDIKLPPGVPFPPLPPAPPPSSTGAAPGPIEIAPREDIRSWEPPSQPMISASSTGVFIRPPPSASAFGLLERGPPFHESAFRPVTSKSPVRNMDNRLSTEIRFQHDGMIPLLGGVLPPPENPMFRGVPPPMQNFPGPRQGIRVHSNRPIDPSLVRLPSNMPPGPMPPGPMPHGPMPPGPMPQRPMIPAPMPHRPAMIVNRFPPPGPMGPIPVRFPPGRPPRERFPLKHQGGDFTGGDFRPPPMPYSDNPALRGNNPRNFDVRNPGPRLDNPLKFQETRPRAPLFDVPRPHRPLDAHIDVDRPEQLRMPAPFEPVVLQFRPERPPFEPEMIRPPFEPNMQRPPFDTNIQRPRFPHGAPRPLLKPPENINPRVRDQRSPLPREPHSLLDGIYEDFSFTEEFERRDGGRERPDYDRPDSEYSRNNRNKHYQKDRQKSAKYGRHNYEGRRSPPRSSEFRYRHDRNDEDRDRYNREEGPSKAKQPKRTKVNKYSALSTPSELEELEEGEVL